MKHKCHVFILTVDEILTLSIFSKTAV